MDLVKLGCGSSAYAGIPLSDAIHRIADVGYSGVEIWAGHERVSQSGTYEDNIRHLKMLLADRNIAVAGIIIGKGHPDAGSIHNGHQNGLSSTDEDYIDNIKHYIRFARALDCSSVTLVPAGSIPGAAKEDLVQSMAPRLKEVAKFARSLGVAIGVSYGPGLIFDTAADLYPLLIKCRGLKISFHVGNSHLACETPCNIAKEFKQHIEYIRIADIGCGNRPYLVPGAGEIEWISFFKTLRWIGYQEFVTVDLSSYTDIPDGAAIRAFHYLTNIINGLRRPRLKKSA